MNSIDAVEIMRDALSYFDVFSSLTHEGATATRTR